MSCSRFGRLSTFYVYILSIGLYLSNSCLLYGKEQALFHRGDDSAGTDTCRTAVRPPYSRRESAAFDVQRLQVEPSLTGFRAKLADEFERGGFVFNAEICRKNRPVRVADK